MLRRGFIVLVIVPLLAVEAYLLSLPHVSWNRNGRLHGLLFSEHGVAEIGTAIFFFVAACVGLSLYVRSRHRLAPRHRAFFLCFALAGLFVALEETSYGQHYFQYKCPQWFAENSSKPEINLHNLFGNKLSNLMRELANLCFPIGCVILPLAFRFTNKGYDKGHWTYYLLPRTELIAIVLIGQGITALENVSKWTLETSMLVRPGEVQELFWSFAAAAYACIMHRRLLGESSEAVILKLPEATEPFAARKAA